MVFDFGDQIDVARLLPANIRQSVSVP
jgi:hypothetical protein